MNNTLENSRPQQSRGQALPWEETTNSNSGFSFGKDENQILINKENSNHESSSLPLEEPRDFNEVKVSSLIDIESNCCNFNNNQRNTRRKIINISIILMNLITLAGIITLLIKK